MGQSRPVRASKGCVNVWYTLSAQPVDATQALNLSAGVNKIKQCRRVATRYDKLAANYLAFIQLASIRLWLRVYEFHGLSLDC